MDWSMIRKEGWMMRVGEIETTLWRAERAAARFREEVGIVVVVDEDDDEVEEGGGGGDDDDDAMRRRKVRMLVTEEKRYPIAI